MTPPFNQSTTLTKTRSVTLDTSGNGLVVLAPDMGQNWAPLFVRVSTNNRNAPVAYCALYHGAPGVPVQQSQFIDDTFTGNGDTSSMISGTPVLFGEALIFNFTGGKPGDTAIASVFGQTSPLPPNLDLVPQVPGTHFAGHLSTEILNVLESRAGSQGPFGIIQGGLIDVRQYASYDLTAQSGYISGTGGDVLPTIVLVTWYTDSTGNFIVYQDEIEFWGNTATNQFPPTYMQDGMHGPYMRVQMQNRSSTDTTSLAWTLLGSTRPITQPYFRQVQSPTSLSSGTGIDGIIAAVQTTVIPANTSITILCPFTYGRIAERIASGGPGTLTVNILYGSAGQQDFLSLPTGVQSNRELIMPKRALEYQLVAPAASNATFNMQVLTLFDKQ